MSLRDVTLGIRSIPRGLWDASRQIARGLRGASGNPRGVSGRFKEFQVLEAFKRVSRTSPVGSRGLQGI